MPGSRSCSTALSGRSDSELLDGSAISFSRSTIQDELVGKGAGRALRARAERGQVRLRKVTVRDSAAA